MRNTLSEASGNTTEPMSRPSMTPPPRSAAQARCRRTISARTAGLAATVLTARVTSGPRISMVASTPSTETALSATAMSRSATMPATSVASAGSMPRRRAAKVTARYMAPVSRYSRSSRSASRRATVDFPEPAGPSMAITLIGRAS